MIQSLNESVDTFGRDCITIIPEEIEREYEKGKAVGRRWKITTKGDKEEGVEGERAGKKKISIKRRRQHRWRTRPERQRNHLVELPHSAPSFIGVSSWISCISARTMTILLGN